MKKVVTVVRVSGIQRYIFRSNRLQDAVAASRRVEWVTDQAIRDVLKEMCLVEPQVYILRSAGGEAVLVFSDLSTAKSFVRKYSRRLYDECPGLEYIVAHLPCQESKLAVALLEIGAHMERAKREKQPDLRLLGLSVTEACAFSNSPAVQFDQDSDRRPISRDVAKLYEVDATERWNPFLENSSFPAGFPTVMDDLGRTRGETSVVGIVHVDGNGVGKAIARWLSRAVEEKLSDEEVLRQYRELSLGIAQSAENAFRAVVKKVLKAVDRSTGEIRGREPRLNFSLNRAGEVDGPLYLPVRPIVLAGDEMTFVCDGRLALSLAETALTAFSQQSIPHLGPISACAGIAIVPARAPFYRAYQLAASLCENAKRARKEANSSDAWMDWHVGLLEPGITIRSLREREYLAVGTPKGRWTLTCRPYPLCEEASSGQLTWRQLDQDILGTTAPGFRSPEWLQHRNKLKELADLILEGPKAIRRGRRSWTRASTLEWPSVLGQNGFISNNRTPILDAIELLDLHLPL